MSLFQHRFVITFEVIDVNDHVFRCNAFADFTVLFIFYCDRIIDFIVKKERFIAINGNFYFWFGIAYFYDCTRCTYITCGIRNGQNSIVFPCFSKFYLRIRQITEGYAFAKIPRISECVAVIIHRSF